MEPQMIFFIRFITATCLFAFLGKANLWLNPLSNIILAIGYRFFLVLSPLFVRLAKKQAVALSLVLASLGALLLAYFNQPSFLAIGALLVGIGLSVSGYLIKSEVAESPKGAAYNKIALNAGSLVSGLILLLALHNKQFFFSLAALSFFAISVLALFSTQKKKSPSLPFPQDQCLRKWFGWILVGVAVGIKLFGVFAVLPQYLLSTSGTLPYWYGLMIFVNSGIIILCQLPIIHWTEQFKSHNHSFKITLTIMILGMLLIATPNLFHANTLIGALIWTIFLSIIECFASYLDVLGSRARFLLVKETSVGLGAGLTVFFSRYFSAPLSSLLIGATGMIALLLVALLLYEDLKTK